MQAGRVGTDLPDRFLSDTMARMLAELRQKYDLILLDSPPVQAIAEARILAGIADATLLCVRWCATPRPVVQHTLELLEEAHAHVVGCVLTRVDARAHVRSGYADADVYHRRGRKGAGVAKHATTFSGHRRRRLCRQPPGGGLARRAATTWWCWTICAPAIARRCFPPRAWWRRTWRTRAAVDAVLADGPWDAVFHFAALSLVGESMRLPFRYLAENGMQRHPADRGLRAAWRRDGSCCPPPPRCSARRRRSRSRRRRGSIPARPYGESKWMIERALLWADRVHGLRSACLRYFNAAGADPAGRLGEDHDPETHLIPLVIDAALGRRPAVEVFGTDYADARRHLHPRLRARDGPGGRASAGAGPAGGGQRDLEPRQRRGPLGAGGDPHGGAGGWAAGAASAGRSGGRAIRRCWSPGRRARWRRAGGRGSPRWRRSCGPRWRGGRRMRTGTQVITSPAGAGEVEMREHRG